MKNPLARGMADATRLTGAGKLTEATALIRAILAPVDAATLAPEATGDVIEGVFERVQPPEQTVKPRRKRATQTRTPLAETLRRIQSGGMPGHSAQVTPPAAPDGASFTTHSYSGPEGAREYKLYRPAAASDQPMPLIIMLHGCTQSPDDFATGTGMNHLAEEYGCLVAYPAQPASANASKCWNWFNPQDQGRDRGEPALIAGITRAVLRDHGADPARVYVAGLSAGGAAAAILAAAYPDLYSAAGVHSGLPIGAASDVVTAFGVMRTGAAGHSDAHSVPMIVFHGDADTTVHPRNGTAVAQQALGGLPKTAAITTTGTAPGGRSFHQTRHTDADGRSICEHWSISGAGHAWSGGAAQGSYTDPTGPDASAEMMRFFLQHEKR